MPVALIVVIIVAVVAVVVAIVWISFSYQLKPDGSVKTWQFVAAMIVSTAGFAAIAVGDALHGSVWGPAILGFAAVAFGVNIYNAVRRYAEPNTATGNELPELPWAEPGLSVGKPGPSPTAGVRGCPAVATRSMWRRRSRPPITRLIVLRQIS